MFVTHRLDEVFELSNRVIVLRDGVKTQDFVTAEISSEQLIRSMVGRDIGDLYKCQTSQTSW